VARGHITVTTREGLVEVDMGGYTLLLHPTQAADVIEYQQEEQCHTRKTTDPRPRSVGS
jgi:hypothetical protein